MASASVPPAPPPPPPIQQSTKILAACQRASANSEHVGSFRSAGNAPKRSPLANIHPETLQHAAANLRKTQYREPLLSLESEQPQRRSDQLPVTGYWSSDPKLRPLGIDYSGAPLPSANSHSDASTPSSELRGYRLPLEATAGITTRPWASNTIAASTAILSKLGNGGYVSPLLSRNNDNTKFSSCSSSSTTHNHPSNLNVNFVKPSGYNFSSTTTLNDANKVLTGNGNSTSEIIPPDYPPPLPPSLSSDNTNFYLSNPQSYIHTYATQTPIGSINNGTNNLNDSSETALNIRSKTAKAYNFAEELRDSTLTSRQKYANQFQQSNIPKRLPPETVAQIYNETTAPIQKRLFETPLQTPSKSFTAVDEIDELIKNMESQLRNASASPTSAWDNGDHNSSLQKINNSSPGNGGHPVTTSANNNFNQNLYRHIENCTKCLKEIIGETPGVTALGKPYHVTCFLCDQCQKQLAGCSFYSVDGKNLCQVDYMNSLDKCDKCATPITSKILRAMGKAFHPECFACPSCTKSLDGIPFTVDPQGVPFCLDCYHERFSPRCAVCLKTIVPTPGETEVARIVAMDRSYHVACYKCEDCNLQLNSKVEGQGCYPLETHLFCKGCNLKRITAKN